MLSVFAAHKHTQRYIRVYVINLCALHMCKHYMLTGLLLTHHVPPLYCRVSGGFFSSLRSCVYD